MRTTNRLFCESPLTHPTAVPMCVCVPGAVGFGELVMDGLYLVLSQMLTSFASICLVNYLDCVYRYVCLCCCCGPDLWFWKPMIFVS